MIKLLHVEDDPDIREIVALALDLCATFDLVQAVSAPDAFGMLDRFTPDAFLVDLMMPDISGAELLAQLRQHPSFRRTPVIFMTARAQTEQIERLIALGAAAVIAKPFDPMRLSAQIRDAVSGV
jgi:CheY-like chemotaxis protein